MGRQVLMENILGSVGLIMGISIILHPFTYDPTKLVGTRILITDASPPLNREIYMAYCRTGTRIVLAQGGPEMAQRCLEAGATQAEVLPAALTSPKDIVNSANRTLGGLDILVLNHGDLEYKASEWTGSANDRKNLRRTMDQGFVSYVALASAALPALMHSQGRIGVVSNMVAKIPVPMLSRQVAAHSALHGFFPALRQELWRRKTGVSVTTMALGYVFQGTGDPGNKTNIYGLDYPFFTEENSVPLEDIPPKFMEYVHHRKPEMTHPFVAQVTSAFHDVFPWVYRVHGSTIQQFFS